MAATSAALAPQSEGFFYAIWLSIGGLALLGVSFISGWKKLFVLLLTCLMLSGLIFLAACGGGSSSSGGGQPGTPAGSYTVTVSATSASLTHTIPVTLTVH
jgi:trimeric autotransporter adhesin